jgi:hypothetical protein
MSPLLILIVLSSVVAVGALAWLVVGVRRDRAGAGQRRPAGADTALRSTIEAVPDPPNHPALTRDLTGEVRIAGTPLDPTRTEVDESEWKRFDRAS